MLKRPNPDCIDCGGTGYIKKAAGLIRTPCPCLKEDNTVMKVERIRKKKKKKNVGKSSGAS